MGIPRNRGQEIIRQITTDTQIQNLIARKKSVHHLRLKNMWKINQRTLLYLTSTHFYPKTMRLEVEKKIQIKEKIKDRIFHRKIFSKKVYSKNIPNFATKIATIPPLNYS